MTALIINKQTMETIFILFVLIVALTELLGLRKEREETIMESIDLASDYFDIKFELEEEKKSNSANNGWNTKYRNTIEEQADIIKRLNTSLDESYIAINAVGNESNKKKRLEQLDKYMTK